MVAAVARFVLGAFVELCQLLLVIVAAIFGVEAATGGRHGAPAPLMLVFLLAYSFVVYLPARDLVEGWLGMIARRRPDRYEYRAENAGRGVMAIVFSVAFIVMWLVLPSGQTSRTGAAFEQTYALLALTLFGLGGAVPRLWFALRNDGWSRPGVIPQLLAQAGKRGAVFVMCMFGGIALGFGGAVLAALVRRHG